jgi:cytochrome oxidase assembly protein ShyY1
MEWRLTLFAAVLTPLLVALGFWQLERAEQKAEISAAHARRQAAPPASLGELAALPGDELAYRRASLRGRFRPGQYFLLDNRIRGGRFGNEVIAPFESQDGGLVLVNRGWVPADPARRELPDVPEVPGSVALEGTVYVPPGDPYLLGEQVLEPGWPVRLQALDIDLMGQALGDADKLFPYTVRIDAGEPGALAVDWVVVNVSPAKHRGYALQWFAMAAALAIAWLLRSSNLWQWLRREEKTR